jgi:signal transduction histidine kinase
MNTVRSIHTRVLGWVLGTLGVSAGLLIGATWWLLKHEMQEVFEDNLKQVALAVVHHRGDHEAPPARLAQDLPKVYEEFGSFEFVTAIWSRDGLLQASSDPQVSLPFLSRSGLSEVRAGGEQWYLYTIVLENAIVQAAQRASDRDTLARETASELVGPSLGVLALVAVWVTLALQRGLRPLSQATSEVAARSAQSLHPIALGTQPLELSPLVEAINDLMGRLGQALTQQRDFVADAAHELRTPVTALRLQLQSVERATDAAERTSALAELQQGIDRTQHLVERLLQLSRVAPEAPHPPFVPVDLVSLVRDTVSRFSAQSEAAGIDLGATSQAAPSVQGDAHQLSVLLDNLVENALRQVPRGGRIDVAAMLVEGHPALVVTDNGPGIPAGERERVFDRFARGTDARGYGSGLGLAIVKAVADRHDAQVQLCDAPGSGLQVRVRFKAT